MTSPGSEPEPERGDAAEPTGGEVAEVRQGRFRRRYGAHPAHLLGHVALIGVAAYALSIVFQARFAPEPLNLILWLLGGAVLHDAVFLPIYGLAWAAIARIIGAGRERDPAHARAVPLANHVRVPLVLSGVLLVTFLPRIANGQPQNFVNALGHEPPDFLGRWLVVTAALAGASALLYGARLVRARANAG